MIDLMVTTGTMDGNTKCLTNGQLTTSLLTAEVIF